MVIHIDFQKLQRGREVGIWLTILAWRGCRSDGAVMVLALHEYTTRWVQVRVQVRVQVP